MKVLGLCVLALITECQAIRFTDIGLANEEHTEMLAE